MSRDMLAPRFAQTRRHQPLPDMSSDIGTLFWNAGYLVEVTRLSSKRYRVAFLGNPWKHKSEDDISEDVGVNYGCQVGEIPA